MKLIEGRPRLTVLIIRRVDSILRLYSSITAFESWQANQRDDEHVTAAYAALLVRRLQ